MKRWTDILRRPDTALGRRAHRRLVASVAAVAIAGVLASILPASVVPAAADTGGVTTTSCPASNPPDELTLAGGSPQTAKLDTPFASPFQVALANSDGCPVTTGVAGTTVTFSAPADGSTTASGAFAASGSSSVAVGTDGSGSASAPAFTANDIAGSYTVTASSSYGSVSFSLTNSSAGIAVSLAAQAPLSQAAFTGAVYNHPLEVLVLDANGNPVEGASVTFSLGSGGGDAADAASTSSAGATFVTGQTQATVTADASGIASSPLFTADATPGSFAATAATPGVNGPATFRLDNVAGKPPELVLVGPAKRSALAGSRYRAPLEVKVLDAAGAPAAGVTVTFALGSGSAGSSAAGSAGTSAAGASFLDGTTQATATTGPRGVAISPFFSANSTAGTFTATVSVTGRTNPLVVRLDNLATRQPAIRPSGADPRSATVGGHYRSPLRVTVVAADGKPVEGTTVTFTLGAAAGGSATSASAGASFVGGSNEATATTNAAGRAVSPAFSANTVAGTFSAVASIAGAATVATFPLRNLAGKPTTLTTGAAVGEQTSIGTSFPIRLAVTVKDGDGNPVAGALVRFTAPARGASGSFAGVHHHRRRAVSVRTDSDGVALAPPFAADATAGGYAVSATVDGADPAAFALVNQPPAQ